MAKRIVIADLDNGDFTEISEMLDEMGVLYNVDGEDDE